MKNQIIHLTITLCLLLTAKIVCAQRAIHHPGGEHRLAELWNWAQKTAREGKKSSGFWIGYSFNRRMAENSWMGSFYSGKQKSVHQLCEVVYGITDDDPYNSDDSDISIKNLARHEIYHGKTGDRIGKDVEKEIAVMFYIERQNTGKFKLEKIKLSNLTLYMNLREAPVYWLGKINTDVSLNFLMKMFIENDETKIQKKLIHAISSHDRPQKVLPFLRKIILGQMKTDSKMRLRNKSRPQQKTITA
ncbi:MAG: hypothetical protein DWQ05_22685 [Calditrichaeota bacterium]|nr:MAG: hypothetical protein DWQ05_22685 [Calditrichota bacterium]